MKSARNGLLAAVGISAGIFLNTQEATAQQNRPALSFEQIAQIVNSTDRTAADRTNDVRRKPEQMLGFIGIRPGIVAVDLSAGGGYTTELLARAIGPSGIDLVTLMFNYHDLGHLGVDRATMNKAVFRALKSGGLYVIADHSGRPGTGISESGTLHRIEEAFLRQEVEAAGFKLVDEGKFLRNPNDPRDKNTPDPPQPKDEFVLKFVKP
jgi:predicted methyltransferase